MEVAVDLLPRRALDTITIIVSTNTDRTNHTDTVYKFQAELSVYLRNKSNSLLVVILMI